MTREHAKQLLPIIKAWSEGGEIEAMSGGAWRTVFGDPNWLLPADNYRIKPQPREFWIVGSAWFCNKEVAWEWAKDHADHQPIHVREVIP